MSDLITPSKALPHERLDAYRVAVQLCAITTEIKPRRGAAECAEQLRRAATSVALNIAESSGRRGNDRRRFFLIARGSALECAAALDVLRLSGSLGAYEQQQGRELCARLYAMLSALARAARR